MSALFLLLGGGAGYGSGIATKTYGRFVVMPTAITIGVFSVILIFTRQDFCIFETFSCMILFDIKCL